MTNSLVKVNRPNIVTGAATNTDAGGNPYPVEPAANHPFGTMLYADSYASGISGSLIFKREKDGSNNPIWVWRWGSYSGSNTDGEYQRDADGVQKCWLDTGRVYTVAAGSSNVSNHTYPKPFISSPIVTASTGEHGTAGARAYFTVRQVLGSSTTEAQITITNDYTASITMYKYYFAIGRWK